MVVIRVDGNIVLRAFAPRHAEPLFALADANRERLRQWLPWVDATVSVEDVRAFIRAAEADWAARKAVHLGIWVDGTLAGAIGSSAIVAADARATLGYWIAAPFEGRGIITRSCAALISWLLAEFRLHRIEIHCAPGNRRSGAVPARLGFTPEGLLREAHRVAGRFDNVEVWGLLAREWKSAQKQHASGTTDARKPAGEP